MAKKRKLGSANPKYKSAKETGEKAIARIHFCDAIIRTEGGQNTGRTAAVYGVWYV